MVRVDYTVMIERPVTEVFAYLTDPANLPEWQSTLVEMRQESDGPMAVGTRLTELRRFLGRTMESTLEVTAYEPNRKWSLKTVSGPVPYSVEHTLEATDGGTRLAWVGEGNPGGFFKFAEPIVARTAKRQFGSDFETLKDILEARG